MSRISLGLRIVQSRHYVYFRPQTRFDLYTWSPGVFTDSICDVMTLRFEVCRLELSTDPTSIRELELYLQSPLQFIFWASL